MMIWDEDKTSLTFTPWDRNLIIKLCSVDYEYDFEIKETDLIRLKSLIEHILLPEDQKFIELPTDKE